MKRKAEDEAKRASSDDDFMDMTIGKLAKDIKCTGKKHKGVKDGSDSAKSTNKRKNVGKSTGEKAEKHAGKHQPKRESKKGKVETSDIGSRKIKKTKYDRNLFPKLMTRTSPYTLVNSFISLNDKQRKAVKGLGFEHILNLTITEIPSRLAYWIVDNFDASSCELVPEKGKSLQIDPIDVKRVFGFPMGKISIGKGGKRVRSDLIDEYVSVFDEGSGKVNIDQKDIVKKMLEDKNGGVWFKRHFIVLLVSSIIEHTSHGYVSANIMQHLGDLDAVKDIDWCTYMLDCLANTKRAWENSKHKAFLGSALFLTVFYVDRVRIFGSKCDRAFPIIVNWDDQLLQDRQKNELKDAKLGCGRPVEAINVPTVVEESETIREEGNNEIPDASKNDEYATKLLNHAKKIGVQMIELMDMIENIPENCCEAEHLKKAIHNSQKLCTGGGCDKSSTEPSQLDSTQADKFWGRSDILRCISEIENVHKKQKEFLNRTDDIPSFSLGLTQIAEEVDHEASEPSKDATEDNEAGGPSGISDPSYMKGKKKVEKVKAMDTNKVKHGLQQVRTVLRM